MPPVALVVEDEPLLLMELADALQQAGWETLEAVTGELALVHVAGSANLSLLVTDILLGGPVTGWEVAAAFRVALPPHPVVYVSGLPPDPGRQVSNSIFLSKPLQLDKLIAACPVAPQSR